MKSKSVLLLLFISLMGLGGCKSKFFGKKMREPFTGNAYESNARFFRGTGKGESKNENIAQSKADMNAKAELAGQVNTTMKQVADQYLNEAGYEDNSETMEQFESITRQVMNTQIADLRKMGEKKYYDGEKYTVFIAYEIKKRKMLKFLKKQAELEQFQNTAAQKALIEMLQQEIDKLPEEDD